MQVIGISGGSGSGKTTFVNKLISALPGDAVALLSQDAYYRDSSHIPEMDRKKINFDHPEAIEWELLIEHIQELKNRKPIHQPIYSMLTCTRNEETITVQPNKVLLVEGILILTNEALRNEMTLKIFIDADADHRLMRVVRRDMEERGREVDEVLSRYLQSVRPMHEQFIEPSKKYADLIVPVGGNNDVAVEVLSRYIRSRV